MHIYLLNIALMIIAYPFWIRLCGKQNGNKCFCIQASIQWILISGLRGISVGADTVSYEFIFENVKNMTWEDFSYIISQYISGVETIKDPGYYLFVKVFQLFSQNYNVFLTFVAILFFIPMGIWIYRNSEKPLLSYIIFSCLFYSFFAITGTRQTIVTGLGVFLGIELLKKKKYILFYIIIILLTPIHKSIAAFAVFPVISKIKPNNFTFAIWMFVIVFSWIFKGALMTFMSGMFGYEEYDQYYEGAGVTNFTYLFMAVLIVGICLKKRTLKKYPEAVVGYNAMLTAAVILPLVSINQSAMRGVQYFSIYLLLFIPWLVNNVKKDQRVYVEIAGTAALILLLINNNPHYVFFWQ